MTKEELEDSIHDAIWDSIYAEGGEVAGGNQAVNKCVDIADEYAKQEAIAFYMFVVKRAFNLNEKETLTLDEIYELYEQSKNNSQ